MGRLLVWSGLSPDDCIYGYHTRTYHYSDLSLDTVQDQLQRNKRTNHAWAEDNCPDQEREHWRRSLFSRLTTALGIRVCTSNVICSRQARRRDRDSRVTTAYWPLTVSVRRRSSNGLKRTDKMRVTGKRFDKLKTKTATALDTVYLLRMYVLHKFDRTKVVAKPTNLHGQVLGVYLTD